MSKPKSSLLEEIRADRPPSGRTPLLMQVASRMNETERQELIEALNDSTISAAAISRALKRRGYVVSAGAINQFRRGEIVHEFA